MEQRIGFCSCPHCGADLTKQGSLYGVYWVPTRFEGRHTVEEGLVLDYGEGGRVMWDWDNGKEPEKQRLACSTCGEELTGSVHWE